MNLDLWHGAVAFGAAFIAGAMNSVAAGGTLLTFPTLIWLGLDSITANATSTVAVWPGTLGTVGGYRKEIGSASRRMMLLMLPSFAGGITGAILLRRTPAKVFDALVPFLILFATIVFIVQEPIQRRLRSIEGQRHESPGWLVGAMLFQFGVAVYGGYFGAGIGIMMLAALGVLGLTDIHQMNGLKALFGASINGVASAYFVWSHMVYWPYFVVMVVAAIAGGYGGARLARRMGAVAVRRIVVAVGLGMALSLFVKYVQK